MDDEVVVGVAVAEVAQVEPALVRRHHLLRLRLAVQVPHEHVPPEAPDLADVELCDRQALHFLSNFLATVVGDFVLSHDP